MLEVEIKEKAKIPKEPNCVFCHFKDRMTCKLFRGESLMGRESYGVVPGIGHTITSIHPVRKCMNIREKFGGETPKTRASINYPKKRKPKTNGKAKKKGKK